MVLSCEVFFVRLIVVFTFLIIRKFAKLETLKVPVITKKRNTSLFERINNAILNDFNMDYEQMEAPL